MKKEQIYHDKKLFLTMSFWFQEGFTGDPKLPVGLNVSMNGCLYVSALW